MSACSCPARRGGERLEVRVFFSSCVQRISTVDFSHISLAQDEHFIASKRVQLNPSNLQPFRIGGDDLSGSVKLNVEPLPTSLSTQILPPCNSTNFLAKVNPSPVPSLL